MLSVSFWFCKYRNVELLSKIHLLKGEKINLQTIQLKISTITTRNYPKTIEDPMQNGIKLFYFRSWTPRHRD